MPPKRKKPVERPHERFYRFRDAVYADIPAAERLLREDPTLLDARNGIGETALHYLAVENQIEAVRWLIARGSDVNTQTKYGETPLMEAASLGHEEMCRLLLAHGADTRIRDQQGNTALSYAASASGKSAKSVARRLIIVELLLKEVSADEDVNAYFEPVTAEFVIRDGGPMAEVLIARGLHEPDWSQDVGA
jgi:ankyrin repeat protein